MRIRSHRAPRGFDMTPMIDIAFLMIAFFMVLINFSEADQHERIRLPRSELAQPPERQPDESLVLQVFDDGNVRCGVRGSGDPRAFATAFHVEEGRLYDSKAFASLLTEGGRVYRSMGKDVRSVTIIIRADAACPTEKIQQIIALCQKIGFVEFKLRVSQGVEGGGNDGTRTDR